MVESIRAILFDLDGTLLHNDMNVFLPHYFEMLAARVAHLVPTDEFMDRLMQASEIMMANDGRTTNESLFAASFYPLAGHSRQELEPVFLDFYANDYPNGVSRSYGQVSYSELKSGRIRLNGKDVPTVPLSSIVKAREIADILKTKISKGKFLLGEPQFTLPR